MIRAASIRTARLSPRIGRASTTIRPMSGVYADLQDRAAVVTGASSGIGLGIAKALLDQGMRVAVHYNRNQDAAGALCAGHPRRALPVQADPRTEEGCGRPARGAVRALGGGPGPPHPAGALENGPPPAAPPPP